MPTIATKIQHPSLNHLVLYKEGVFWVAYEQSAYFIAQFKEYKPTKKYFKNIDRFVVSVGFPNVEALINEMKQKHTIQSVLKTDITIEIILKEAMNNNSFEVWKESILDKSQLKSFKTESVESLVKAFPLANKTPMEAFLFIEELQKSLNLTKCK